MSLDAIDKWCCDRCGQEMALDRNEQPGTWHRLADACPPNHAEPDNLGELCEPCWISFCNWWRDPDA